MTTLTDSIANTDSMPEARTVSRVAYLMSRFPKLTETFVLFEMCELERLGIQVEIYPLRRQRASVVHEQAQSFVQRAHFTPWLSIDILLAHLRFLRTSAKAYLETLVTLLRANLGSMRYLAGALVFFPKAVYLAQRIQDDGIEHIHAHFASHPAAVAFVIHRLTGISFSFTAHGSDLHRDRHMLGEKVRAASAVVTISDDNRRLIIDECGTAWRDKIHVIHCGVDTRRLKVRCEATPFEQGTGRFQIACIGTLHEVKGQHELIEACRQLQRQGLEFDCHLIGDGPDRRLLNRQVVAAGLNEHVHFYGQQSAERIGELLEQIDLLVSPSVPARDGRREGIPVVLMEAMAKGVPVVASRLSGIPELVCHEKTGLLVPPREPAVLASAIMRLVQNSSLRRRLTSRARRKVEAKFNLAINTRELATRFQ